MQEFIKEGVGKVCLVLLCVCEGGEGGEGPCLFMLFAKMKGGEVHGIMHYCLYY